MYDNLCLSILRIEIENRNNVMHKNYRKFRGRGICCQRHGPYELPICHYDGAYTLKHRQIRIAH